MEMRAATMATWEIMMIKIRGRTVPIRMSKGKEILS